MNHQKYYTISWDQLHKDSRALAWKLTEEADFEAIIAITRGGMVPAAIIARELSIRKVDCIAIASYDEENQGEIKTLKNLNADFLSKCNPKKVLVIDDLADSGKTIRYLKQQFPDFYYACLYVKPNGKDTVKQHVMEFSQDTWLLFPWDVELQFSAPIVKKK